MIKAVLFDFDDTLVKTKSIRYKAIKKAGKKFYNLNISDADIDKYWGKPFDSFISDIFINSDTVRNLTNNYKSILPKYPNEQITDTNKVVKQLSQNFLLGIISSNNPDLIRGGMKDVKLSSSYFFFIQSSKDTKVHKPNLGVFLPSLEKLEARNISKNEVLYVGDALDDYEVASSTGLHFCGIANRTVKEKTYIERKIPYIKAISELPRFIKKI